jgi:hypothetical protein
VGRGEFIKIRFDEIRKGGENVKCYSYPDFERK